MTNLIVICTVLFFAQLIRENRGNLENDVFHRSRNPKYNYRLKHNSSYLPNYAKQIVICHSCESNVPSFAKRKCNVDEYRLSLFRLRIMEVQAKRRKLRFECIVVAYDAQHRYVFKARPANRCTRQPLSRPLSFTKSAPFFCRSTRLREITRPLIYSSWKKPPTLHPTAVLEKEDRLFFTYFYTANRWESRETPLIRNSVFLCSFLSRKGNEVGESRRATFERLFL